MQSQPRPIFDNVVAVGREGLTPALAKAFDGNGGAVLITAGECEDILLSRPESECWDLLRGFVTLEERLGWRDGSVAAGNVLARAFVQHFPHCWADAVAWLRENAKANTWYFTKHSPLSFDSVDQWRSFMQAEQQRKA
jgi:hypothetical protein